MIWFMCILPISLKSQKLPLKKGNFNHKFENTNSNLSARKMSRKFQTKLRNQKFCKFILSTFEVFFFSKAKF